MAKINRTGAFDQMYLDLCKEFPDLEPVITQRIRWFKKNPKDTRLDNHLLLKPMEDKWAFSITDDLRIVYDWTTKTTARFLDIGPHSKVYAKKRAKKKTPKK